MSQIQIQCGHEWEQSSQITQYFKEVNSSRKAKDCIYYKCKHCTWIAYKYLYSDVMYTWNPDRRDWET